MYNKQYSKLELDSNDKLSVVLTDFQPSFSPGQTFSHNDGIAVKVLSRTTFYS